MANGKAREGLRRQSKIQKNLKKTKTKIVVKINGQLRGRRRTLLDAQNNQSGTKRGAGAWEGNMKSRIEQNTHFFGDGLGEFLVFKHK